MLRVLRVVAREQAETTCRAPRRHVSQSRSQTFASFYRDTRYWDRYADFMAAPSNSIHPCSPRWVSRRLFHEAMAGMLIAFVALLSFSQMLATTWINPAKGYQEFSGPYGFVIDAENQPHLIIRNWRPRNRHEFEQASPKDEEERRPRLLHAFSTKDVWHIADLPVDAEAVTSHVLTSNESRSQIWLAALDADLAVQVSRWDQKSFKLTGALSPFPQNTPTIDEHERPLYELAAIGIENDLWIALIHRHTGHVTLLQASVDGPPEIVSGFQCDALLNSKDLLKYSLELFREDGMAQPAMLISKLDQRYNLRPNVIIRYHQGQWTTQNIEPDLELTEETLRQFSLFDSRVHAVVRNGSIYAVGGLGELFFSKRDATGDWSYQVIDSSAWKDPRLRFDKEGEPWILYGSNFGGDRETPSAIARRENGQWAFEDIAPSVVMHDLQFGPDGQPWVAFSDLDAVYIAEHVDGGWKRKLVAGSGGGGGPISDLRVVGDDRVQALISAREGLLLAEKREGEWSTRLIDSLGYGGNFYRRFYSNPQEDFSIQYWKLTDGIYQRTRADLSPFGIITHALGLATADPHYWSFESTDLAWQLDEPFLFLNQDLEGKRERWRSGGVISLHPPSHRAAETDYRLLDVRTYPLRAILQASGKQYSKAEYWVVYQNDGDPDTHSNRDDMPFFYEKLEFPGGAGDLEFTNGPRGERVCWEVRSLGREGSVEVATKKEFNVPTVYSEAEPVDMQAFERRRWNAGKSASRNGYTYSAWFDVYRGTCVLSIESRDGERTQEDIPTRL